MKNAIHQYRTLPGQALEEIWAGTSGYPFTSKWLAEELSASSEGFREFKEYLRAHRILDSEGEVTSLRRLGCVFREVQGGQEGYSLRKFSRDGVYPVKWVIIKPEQNVGDEQ